MPELEETTEIRAPIAEVFTALTDPARTPEWNPNVVSVSGVTYPVQEGSTWTQVLMAAGRPMNLQCRVTTFQPPHEGALAISGDQRGRTWTRCQEGNGATHVTQGLEFEMPGGVIGRVTGAFAREALRRELQRTMERQRETLEREAGAAGGPGTR